MKIINYEFAAPNLLEDIICKMLIMYNINYCLIKDEKLIEIHFDNYILRIVKNSDKIVFDTNKLLLLISGLQKSENEININKSKEQNSRLKVGYYDINNIVKNLETEIDCYKYQKNNTKYTDINYVSKKKILKNSNKKQKINTRRK